MQTTVSCSFPIVLIDLTNPAQKAQHDVIFALAERMHKLSLEKYSLPEFAVEKSITLTKKYRLSTGR